jgi:two-component system, sensor histidine kinase PdtaS
VHHRVKNNLQLINSMLNIQARRNNYEDIYDFLKKGETRINSMALIHQSLYQTEKSLDKINFQPYAKDLAKSISHTFENSLNTIEIDVKAANIVLNLDTAIPLGIIINELLTNALKYAFPENRTGKITIAIIQNKPNEYLLTVEDNGIGFDTKRLENKSFGLELINLLVSQLNGTITFESKKHTKYEITFEETV